MDTSTDNKLTTLSSLTDKQYSTSEISDSDYIPWYILYALICIPTVVGNSIILTCLFKCRKTWSSVHILIGNLAVSDLIFGAILLPYCMVTDALHLNPVKYFCLLKVSLMVLAVGTTCYGLLLISIDRFSAVCYPFSHHRTFSPKRILFMLFFGWTYIGLIAIFPLSGWNFYDRNLPYSCKIDQVLTPIYQRLMNGNFILLLGINLVLYIIVIRISVRKSRVIYSRDSSVSDSQRHSAKRELYKVKTMAIVQGLFAVCWFPYVVLAITIMFSDNPVLHEIQYWSLIPGIFHSSINWMIYGYRNKQLRRQIRSHFRCLFCKENMTVHSETS